MFGTEISSAVAAAALPPFTAATVSLTASPGSGWRCSDSAPPSSPRRTAAILIKMIKTTTDNKIVLEMASARTTSDIDSLHDADNKNLNEQMSSRRPSIAMAGAADHSGRANVQTEPPVGTLPAAYRRARIPPSPEVTLTYCRPLCVYVIAVELMLEPVLNCQRILPVSSSSATNSPVSLPVN